MTHKKLVGSTESITYAEAEELFEKHKTEFLYWMKGLIDEATSDEEERAQIAVNMAGKLGTLLNACELMGVLEGSEEYLAKIPYNDNVRIEEEKDA